MVFDSHCSKIILFVRLVLSIFFFFFSNPSPREILMIPRKRVSIGNGIQQTEKGTPTIAATPF